MKSIIAALNEWLKNVRESLSKEQNDEVDKIIKESVDEGARLEESVDKMLSRDDE